MALYFWKICVGWTVYIMSLLLVQSATTLHDDGSYFNYNTLEPGHRSVAELNINFLDSNGAELSRQKRHLDESGSRTSISQIRSIVNTSLQNSQSSNSAFPNSKPFSNSHSDSSHDDGLTHVQLSSAISERNRLQTIKQATRVGPVLQSTSEPSGTGTSANHSVNSPNNSTYVSSNNGQIISATFEANAKTGSVVGTPADALRDKESDISITQFPDEITNATLKQENITEAHRDNHVYYNSTFLINEKIGQQHWVELSDKNDVKIHEMLSQSHRRAATVQLSFDFPFYGHLVTNVTIATGGFLFTGDHIHSWLAATQYIAPLMANFDNRISDDSFVKYYDNGTAFIVLWENVVLKDSPESGNFTFEAILHSNGDIVFVYKSIPIPVENIKDDQHPVKVGLSDAYIIDRTIFFVKRKTIYEYHRVNFSKVDIKNWTVIYLNALPTCLDMKDCETCLSANINLECKWCPALERCSTGVDRARQKWLSHECDSVHVTVCNESPPPPYAHKAAEISLGSAKHKGARTEKSRSVLGTSGVISLLLVMTSIAAAGFIFLYAYRNPHSTPGQILIRYRPTQWRFRRGEARYTAATIHM